MNVERVTFIRERWAECVTIVLGLWLAASTLLFPHGSSAGFDTLMIGVFIAANAVQALWAPWFRYVNTGLALFLLVTELEFGDASLFRSLSTLGTAALVLVLSFVPSPPRLVHPRQAAVGYRP
jgi:hypothetical protein